MGHFVAQVTIQEITDGHPSDPPRRSDVVPSGRKVVDVFKIVLTSENSGKGLDDLLNRIVQHLTVGRDG